MFEPTTVFFVALLLFFLSLDIFLFSAFFLLSSKIFSKNELYKLKLLLVLCFTNFFCVIFLGFSFSFSLD